MRQILLNNAGAMIARMPRPLCERGAVLVRVRYSLISTGTEVAPLRAQVAGGDSESTPTPYHRIAADYLGKALSNPAKAAQRVAAITRSLMAECLSIG